MYAPDSKFLFTLQVIETEQFDPESKENWEEVLLGYMAEMRRKLIQPDVVTLNTLIRFYLPSYPGELDVAGAQRLIESMEERGVEPDTVTYSTFIKVQRPILAIFAHWSRRMPSAATFLRLSTC